MQKYFIFFMLFFIFMGSQVQAQEKGITINVPDQVYMGSSAKVYYPGLIESSTTDQRHQIQREGWGLIDSVSFSTYINPGKHLGVLFDGTTGTLSSFSDFEELTPEGQQAVAKCPAWLRPALKNNLARLSEENQQIWSAIILDAQDPYIDEIAFCVAHSSPAYLASNFSHPELFVENAELLYAIDLDLSYVTILDYGNSATDDDYYSTTKYWKQDEVGNLYQVEVPRDVYYWYVVHPKISDEIPAYIDPQIIEDNDSHQNNITPPESGEFWRDFLYNHADPDYPLLKDYLMECTTVLGGTNAAINTLSSWLGATLEFTSDAERPHQPVRIYRKHIGRCGEHQDIRAAIGRIGLIPSTCILSISTDHVWNEFWDEDWKHWDGGDIDNPMMYENGWGKVFGSVFECRSDGVYSPVTDTYSAGVANITIYVVDAENKPVDGARIIVRMQEGTALKFDTAAHTDSEGKYTFVVGDNRTYWARMDSDIGNDPQEDGEYSLLTTTEAGGEYEFYFTASGLMPTPQFTQIDPPEDSVDDYKLVAAFTPSNQVVTGGVLLNDLDYCDYYHSTDGGVFNFFMTDPIEYNYYTANENFNTFNSATQATEGSYEFELPMEPLPFWYAFWTNGHRLKNPQFLSGYVLLYNHDDFGGFGTISGIITNSEDQSPLAGATVTAGVYQAITDENGAYTLEVYPNDYQIVASANSYLAVSENISVSDGGSVVVDFDLAPLYAQPASNPSPGDFAEDISPAANLSWLNGAHTETIDLYFGLNNPPTTLLLDDAEPVTNFVLDTLSYGNTYYWQVISRNIHGQVEGEIWNFTVESVPIIENGLVGYYHFEGNLDDASGNDYDGILHGMVVYVNGPEGQAIGFDGGTGNYVSLGSEQQVRSNKARSFACWGNTQAFNTAGLFQAGTTGIAGGDFSLRTKNVENEWRVQFWGEPDFDAVLDNSFDNWHYYCLTYDGVTAKLYYDGVLAEYDNVSLNTGEHDIWLGRWADAYFEGLIDEFTVWNRCLNEDEVAQLHQGQNPLPGVITGVITDGVTRTPIAGAIVNAGQFQVVTDQDGVYSVDVFAGTYNVTASANGFSPTTILDISVMSQEEVIVDIMLEATGIVDGAISHLPKKSALYQNYPNPFNPETIIQFEVAGNNQAMDLSVYDISGKLIKTLIDGPMKGGYHSVVWDGVDNDCKAVNSGVYFYKMETEDYRDVKRCIMLK